MRVRAVQNTGPTSRHIGRPCAHCTKPIRVGHVVLVHTIRRAANQLDIEFLLHKKCVERILDGAPPDPETEFADIRRRIMEQGVPFPV